MSAVPMRLFMPRASLTLSGAPLRASEPSYPHRH